MPIGPVAGSDWLYSVPWGLEKLLCWVNRTYGAPPIYITENGCDDVEGTGVDDIFRVQYLHGYLSSVAQAILDGVDVRGYFVWSLLDNFEWGDGVSRRFGLYHVTYGEALARTPKRSVSWFSKAAREWPHVPVV